MATGFSELKARSLLQIFLLMCGLKCSNTRNAVYANNLVAHISASAVRFPPIGFHNDRIDGLANGVIKVADFGLAEDMYGTNYYRRGRSEGGERVPIRWMAPESIEMNIYNERTDVVSYRARNIL